MHSPEKIPPSSDKPAGWPPLLPAHIARAQIFRNTVQTLVRFPNPLVLVPRANESENLASQVVDTRQH